MGFYITCDICGASEKGMAPDCGCQIKRGEDDFQQLVGLKIIAAKFVNDSETVVPCPTLFIQAINEQGELVTFELSTTLCEEEYVLFRPFMTQVDNDDFPQDDASEENSSSPEATTLQPPRVAIPEQDGEFLISELMS